MHVQLLQAIDELGWKSSRVDPGKPEGARAIHRALAAGLLGNVGMKDEADANYTGARGIKFWVHPGSATRKPGKWILAAELVETTRLYGRSVATIDPKWLEEIGAHVLKRHHERTGRARARVVAPERGTLYGLPTPTGASTMARSIRSSRAKSSCARRSSKAITRRVRRSSRITGD